MHSAVRTLQSALRSWVSFLIGFDRFTIRQRTTEDTVSTDLVNMKFPEPIAKAIAEFIRSRSLSLSARCSWSLVVASADGGRRPQLEVVAAQSRLRFPGWPIPPNCDCARLCDRRPQDLAIC